VELFEQIRREYEHGDGTIKGVARKFKVDRRMVREAVANAMPRERKIAIRERPRLGPAVEFIDAVLEEDRKVVRGPPTYCRITTRRHVRTKTFVHRSVSGVALKMPGCTKRLTRRFARLICHGSDIRFSQRQGRGTRCVPFKGLRRYARPGGVRGIRSDP